MGQAPGKFFRKGMTIMEMFEMFPDDKTAEQWFINIRWPDGIRCGHCGSERVSKVNPSKDAFSLQGLQESSFQSKPIQFWNAQNFLTGSGFLQFT